MKKLLVFIFAMFCTATHAAQIVNVEYIHKYINQKHGIEIPYSPQLQSPKQAANMKYMLTLVDIANKKLNGFELTTYGTDEKYATTQAVDTVATITAVDTLITSVEYPFHFTPAVTSTTYDFTISAAGTFYVDWGDGTSEKIVKTNTNVQTISHTYATAAKNYNIGLGGRATGYSDGNVISFFDTTSRVSKIDGCLGCVFGTIGDGTPTSTSQPKFSYMLTGELSGTIPKNMFAGLHGPWRTGMFNGTFYNCSKLTGEIPENLFAGLKGAPTRQLFKDLFIGCRGLTGEIPADLFAGVTPTGSLFNEAFQSAFSGCTGLTGESPKINGKHLYEIWGYSYPTAQPVYRNCTGLTDYTNMPTGRGWR